MEQNKNWQSFGELNKSEAYNKEVNNTKKIQEFNLKQD